LDKMGDKTNVCKNGVGKPLAKFLLVRMIDRRGGGDNLRIDHREIGWEVDVTL